MDYEEVTIPDLVKMQQDLLGSGKAAYSVRYMKQKLTERFGDALVVGTVIGRADVVSLKHTVTEILHDLHKKQKRGKSDESVHIIKAAAALVRKDIKALDCDKSNYPALSEMTLKSQLEFIPVSLQTMLHEIFKGKDASLKVGAVG
ncbi:hypothetical protein ACOMHN_051203 [Nucella lapillus]